MWDKAHQEKQHAGILGAYNQLEKELVSHINLVSTETTLKLILKNIFSIYFFASSFIS